MLCLLGHLSRSGARRAGNGSGRGRTGRGAGRYRRAFRRQPGADRPGVAALRSGHAGPLRPARTPARRGRCRQRRDPAYHQGQRFHRWRQRHAAGRASELEQALRRADPLRGMEILAGIRLDELPPVRCLPAPPAGDVRRRAGGVGELNPGAVASPAKDPGGPARLHPLACRANNAMGVIRRYSCPPGLERHPLPVVQYLPGVAQQVMGVEQGVGDFRALLQAAADGGGNRPGGSCGRAPAAPRSACGCRACCAPRRRPGRSAGGCPVEVRRSRCSSLPGCAGFQASGQALLFRRVRRRMRRSAPARSRLAFADAGAGGRAGGGAGSAHGTIIRTGVPRRYAPSPSRARFSASAAPCPAAPGR